MAYATPLRLLQKLIDAREFAELKAFKKRNTLSPDLWKSTTDQTSWLYMGQTGEYKDPASLMPTTEYDHDADKAAREASAERSLNNRAE